MAKNFPYFKFVAAEWLTGDIVFEPLEVQGLFINICAIYWQRDGNLSIEDIEKRYKQAVAIRSLSGRFFSVNEGKISIKFMDEQLVDAGHISKVNSENGKKGAEARSAKLKEKQATAKRPLSENERPLSKEKKNKRKGNKITFQECDFFDKVKFKAAMPEDWSKVKLAYYYDAALRYSKEGNKYIEWNTAVISWAKKDELQGKINFVSKLVIGGPQFL